MKVSKMSKNELAQLVADNLLREFNTANIALCAVGDAKCTNFQDVWDRNHEVFMDLVSFSANNPEYFCDEVNEILQKAVDVLDCDEEYITDEMARELTNIQIELVCWQNNN